MARALVVDGIDELGRRVPDSIIILNLDLVLFFFVALIIFFIILELDFVQKFRTPYFETPLLRVFDDMFFE